LRGAAFVVCVLLSTLSLPGCVRLALDAFPSFIPGLTQAFFEECDPDLARNSLPAELKLLEGLLKNDPGNKQVLTALCMGFTGYALLFVEQEDPQRASRLYERAMGYGFSALGLGSPLNRGGLTEKKARLERLRDAGPEDAKILFWSSMSWNAWINLNLDRPTALAQLGTAEAYLKRLLEIKPDYFFGVPYVLMGSILSAKPGLLGGEPKRAKACFEEAIRLSGGKFLLVHYYFAKYYAVRVQNKTLFQRLIREVEDTDPSALRQACLINAVMKQRVRHLKEREGEFFF